MKFYVAGSFSDADRIRSEAQRLIILGHEVTGVWFDREDALEQIWDKDFGGRIAELMALRDIRAIDRADIVLLDSIKRSSTGGSDSELGYAIDYRPIYLVGPYTNIFHTFAERQFDDWNEAISFIREEF
jgi:nucleoside 2-deoxyribosyltransferase